MLVKEIKEKLPIQFEDVSDDYEVSNLEYCRLIKAAYTNELKFKNGNINPLLKEEYEKLDDVLISIKNIKDVVFIEEGYLERRNTKEINSFIVIEDDIDMYVYNVTTGEDHTYDFDSDIIFNEDKVHILYEENPEDYQDEINIGRIKDICLYKGVTIKNEISNYNISIGDVVVITDKFDHKIFIDILKNKIYARHDSYSIVTSDSTKKKVLYEYGKKNKVKIKDFKNIWYSLFNIFFEEVDD